MHRLDIPRANARVFHNSDWSGDAHIIIDPDGADERSIHVPGAVLLALGREAALALVRQQLIASIEEIRWPEESYGGVVEPVASSSEATADVGVSFDNPASVTVAEVNEKLRKAYGANAPVAFAPPTPADPPPSELHIHPCDEELFSTYRAAALTASDAPVANAVHDAIEAVIEHRKLFPLRVPAPTRPAPLDRLAEAREALLAAIGDPPVGRPVEMVGEERIVKSVVAKGQRELLVVAALEELIDEGVVRRGGSYDRGLIWRER